MFIVPTHKFLYVAFTTHELEVGAACQLLKHWLQWGQLPLHFYACEVEQGSSGAQSGAFYSPPFSQGWAFVWLSRVSASHEWPETWVLPSTTLIKVLCPSQVVTEIIASLLHDSICTVQCHHRMQDPNYCHTATVDSLIQGLFTATKIQEKYLM